MTYPKRAPRTWKPIGWEYQVFKHSKRVGDIVEKLGKNVSKGNKLERSNMMF